MRFVVSQRTTGLGDCVLSLLSAWRYARATGRTLVIDWRGSCYADDPKENVFTRFFAPLSGLEGVPVLLAPIELPRDRWPQVLHPSPDGVLERERWLAEFERERQEVVAMIESGLDVPWPVVFFRGCLPLPPPPELCRRLFGALAPVREVADAVDGFAREHLSGRPVVGVHVRHGNGGDIMAHAKYWEPHRKPLSRCVEAIRAAKRRLGPDAAVFVCTDSCEVLEALTREIDGLVVREKMLLPPGAGELHLEGENTAQDAFVEMLLLARSQVLIRYPPDSYFSWWASLYAKEVVGPLTIRAHNA